MAKNIESKEERAIVFITEGSSYPSVKRGWFTDSEWKRILFSKFDVNDRDYVWINERVVLVFIRKGN